jgi:hypothetical protein
MRITLNILGVLLVLGGAFLFLQGSNVLRGKFMTGQIHWAVDGGIWVIVGCLALLKANRGLRKR